MTPTATLTLVDGTRIVVPDSLELITPYVLREQHDWFEDEIKFLRRLLQSGQNAIDIGANYGVYTLSIAQAVGPTGRVWAFEPASSTASLLAQGIAANGFAQVVLEQSAVSSTSGTAQLSINRDSELNALTHGAPSTTPSETVRVVSLDECLKTYRWRDIFFVKIDAEGEETNILKSGSRFFSELSPLVQYEIMADTAPNMALVQHFAAMGYESYRLAPGLDLLIPFNAESVPDKYLLNLFCCKRDRAEQLAARGKLVGSAGPVSSPRVENRNAYGWHNTIAKLPYGATLVDLWEETMAEGESADVDQALSFYAISQDASLNVAVRFRALENSLRLLTALCERDPAHMRLASLARVAQEYGARSLAVKALQQLNNAIYEHNRVDPSEPFLTPNKRFDTIPPGDNYGDWVLASILEEFERLGHFSSFYTGRSARERLETIRKLGFGSTEMERRLVLLRQRFDRPAP